MNVAATARSRSAARSPDSSLRRARHRFTGRAFGEHAPQRERCCLPLRPAGMLARSPNLNPNENTNEFRSFKRKINKMFTQNEEKGQKKAHEIIDSTLGDFFA